jgi:DNA mismatch repair protein MutS
VVVEEKALTPLMQQYTSIKQQFPDALLLFQVGDFYELFWDDAKQAAATLGITLTKRGKSNDEPIPLCGVPVHALDHYLGRLVKSGFNVAICDQLEPAVPGKVVERGVTRVLTPGTLTDTKLLQAKSASYIFSFFPLEHQWGLLFGELLTAQLFATVLEHNAYSVLESELNRFFPDEILIPDTMLAKQYQGYFKKQGYSTTLVPFIVDDDTQTGAARGWISRQFKREVAQHLYAQESMRHSVYNFYRFLKKNQEGALEQFKAIHFYKPEDFLLLDAATQRNLELVTHQQDGHYGHTLFEHLDHAVTAMGSRMLKKWLVRPLVKQEAIEQRHNALQLLIDDIQGRHQLETQLSQLGDIERVLGRIALNRAHLHDYLMLAQALLIMPLIKEFLIHHHTDSLLGMLLSRIADFRALQHILTQSLNDDTTKEWLIKKGFDESLDRLRELVEHGHTKIMELELREQQATGIQSLKIKYNQVHGYAIEITKTNLDAVPSYYIRQQTLVGRERFITAELKQLQSDIMAAHQEIKAVEAVVFERIKQEVAHYLLPLRQAAQALAQLDALLGLSKVAYHNGYVRPVFNEHREIIIEQGRHPVVAQVLGHHFIPNDTHLTNDQSLWIITGPNMGGKSTYLRQVALICIMAQCGSLVPARSACLPLLDRIFTRIGAGDNVSAGKSTFLVEMEETALICSQATDKSLVILDEVGRGTSTFDGLAIAQAVVEYIYNVVQARCLFATHYHELTELKHQFPRLVSYYTASKKIADGIVFLYKMVPGTADGSFGLEVAKLAGLPKPVIQRAQAILERLLQQETLKSIQIQTSTSTIGLVSEDVALAEIKFLKQELVLKNELLGKFINLDYDNLSPRQAFDLLWSLKKEHERTL